MKIDYDLPLGLRYNLNERLQKAYLRLIGGISSMETEVIIPLYDMDELLAVSEAIWYDYPELRLVWCYERSGYTIRQVDNRQKEMIVCMQYLEDEKGIKRRIDTLERKAEEILEACIGKDTGNDAIMVKSICSYMMSHYQYSDQLPDGNYPGYAYTVECLLRGDGVCSGFASGLTYLLRKLQIPVVAVLGKASGGRYGRHAWNIVQYADGTYRHIDVTWDMGRVAEQAKFFDMDDWAMRARRHFWCGMEYPECG